MQKSGERCALAGIEGLSKARRADGNQVKPLSLWFVNGQTNFGRREVPARDEATIMADGRLQKELK
jgi:hypothetical protein